MKQRPAITPVRAAIVLLALGLSACSSINLSGDRIDYGQAARKTNPLETPPDLTPIARDSRYQPQAGTVSASRLQAAGATPAQGPLVAPQAVGALRIERQGETRWLVSPQSPEQLFPRVRQFWMDRGFALTIDSAEAGVIETDWAENRAKLPSDIIRNTIGRLLESFYSTGERDRFRTRIERGVNGGTEITVSHRGLEEKLVGEASRDGSTVWTRRPTDPLLEAEMLTRLMISLGATEASAKAELASTTAAPAQATVTSKARVLSGRPAATLEIDESAERAWRSIGLALDRAGFTVEDRDRSQLIYFVRYADPKSAGNEEPGFFSRLFSSDKGLKPMSRFRLALKPAGNGTQVSVLNGDGVADNSAGADSIVKLLLEEMKP